MVEEHTASNSFQNMPSSLKWHILKSRKMFKYFVWLVPFAEPAESSLSEICISKGSIHYSYTILLLLWYIAKVGVFCDTDPSSLYIAIHIHPHDHENENEYV